MAREVRRSVTVGRPRAEVWAYWRRLENLPRFMVHLESVTERGDGSSRWVAKGPAGQSVEWDAEITEEREGETLAWRSKEGARVPNGGEVRFAEAPGGRGTEVRVALTYEPPAGAVGAAVAKLFGEEPDQQVREDLRRFKALLETGEIPTTEGQPSGRPLKDDEKQARQEGPERAAAVPPPPGEAPPRATAEAASGATAKAVSGAPAGALAEPSAGAPTGGRSGGTAEGGNA